MTAMSLRAYSVGLLAFMLIKVLAPGYFSRQDTKTPVKIAVWAMVANMVLNLSLVWSLQHAGLALATSISSFLNAGLLFAGLYRSGVFRPQAGWPVFALRLFAANLVMMVFIQELSGEVSLWLSWSAWERSYHLAVLCLGGGLVYLLALWLMGVRVSHFRH